MPCSPVLAPLLPDVPLGFTAGPLLLPGSPFTPGPELGAELGRFVLDWLLLELSAANAGAMPITVAKAHAAMNVFMAFPSFFRFALRTENASPN
jgi:hypothetical protein